MQKIRHYAKPRTVRRNATEHPANINRQTENDENPMDAEVFFSRYKIV